MPVKRRILLVEDNPADAFLAKRFLPEYDVEHAPTFKKGLEAAGRGGFDAALLDMHLPDGEGPGLVRRLQQRAPALPIVVMTGSRATGETALEGLALGAQDWLSKDGMDRDRLNRALEHAIARKALESRLAESEARFMQFSDNAPTIFWISAADFSKIVYVNAAYDRITGTNRERLYEDPSAWLGLIHPEDRALVQDAMEKLARGEGPLDLRCRIRRPDTTIRWLRVRGFTILDAKGEIDRIAATIDDVTELENAKRDAEASKARLEEVQRFRVQLLNNVAHDMSTPLMVMQLRLDALADKPTDADGGRVIDARTFQALRTAGEQLAALTRDLRDVSLMEAGAFRLHVSDLDLGKLARETVAGLDDLAQLADVRIAADVPDAPLMVKGDADRLNQAMMNLVTNAIKFSPRKGEVKLRLRREAGRVLLDVVDEGPGIPPGARDRLFIPFSQVHTDLKVKKGTGLGLYIVRGIMQAHGGSVGLVESRQGQGATFRLELPEAAAS